MILTVTPFKESYYSTISEAHPIFIFTPPTLSLKLTFNLLANRISVYSGLVIHEVNSDLSFPILF